MTIEQLPVTMNHPDATKPKEPLPRPTLLIVDDEAGPRESLRIVFKDRYNCAVATCGREGIDYARANHVDAAILDIKMPDLSGVEVLRELRRSTRTSSASCSPATRRSRQRARPSGMARRIT